MDEINDEKKVNNEQKNIKPIKKVVSYRHSLKFYDIELNKFNTLMNNVDEIYKKEMKNTEGYKKIEDKIIKQWDKYKNFESKHHNILYKLLIQKNKILNKYLI